MSDRHVGLPVEVHRSVSEAAALLSTTQSDVVVRALNQFLPTISPTPAQQQLGGFPPLPVGYHRSATRIFHAIVDLGGGPVTSTQIAERLGLHRGNVDRHLARLRSDGYVERTPVGHRIVLDTPSHQESTNTVSS